MRTNKEILDFVEEQIYMVSKQANDQGHKLPFLTCSTINPNQEILDQKYWLYQTLKSFIEGKI